MKIIISGHKEFVGSTLVQKRQWLHDVNRIYRTISHTKFKYSIFINE